MVAAENTRNSDVLIVGGGVIGVACAYYLLKEGVGVRLIEKKHVGDGASAGNCGLISPSYALPLSAPGVVGKTLKGIILGDTPLYIKPRLDFSLWKWLFQFSSNCNNRDRMHAAAARANLLTQSKILYEQLIERERLECDWESIGHFVVLKTEFAMEEYSRINDILKQFDLGGKSYVGKELADKEPALKEDIYGGWFYDMDAHLRPDELMKEWKSTLLRKGAIIEENCEFHSFEFNGQTVSKIKTSRGDFRANTYIVTMGAWTSLVENQLNLKIPIQPGKGYSMTMDRPKICPKYPCSFIARKVVATPWESGYRLGGIMEFSGYSSKINRSRIQSLITAANEYLREPLGQGVSVEWEGLRPMTYDGLPLIGRSPKQENVYIAAGHNMLGLSMATSTGKLISEMITGQEPHMDITPYSLKRF